jgi:hypothetical protein
MTELRKVVLVPTQKPSRKQAEKGNEKSGYAAMWNGYTYFSDGHYISKTLGIRYYWKCTEVGCKSRLTTDENDFVVSGKGKCDHEAPTKQVWNV